MSVQLCHQIVNSAAGSSPTISGGKIIFLHFRPVLEDLRLKSTDPLGTYLTEHLVEGMAVRERQWMDRSLTGSRIRTEPKRHIRNGGKLVRKEGRGLLATPPLVNV